MKELLVFYLSVRNEFVRANIFVTAKRTSVSFRLDEGVSGAFVANRTVGTAGHHDGVTNQLFALKTLKIKTNDQTQSSY